MSLIPAEEEEGLTRTKQRRDVEQAKLIVILFLAGLLVLGLVLTVWELRNELNGGAVMILVVVTAIGGSSYLAFLARSYAKAQELSAKVEHLQEVQQAQSGDISFVQQGGELSATVLDEDGLEVVYTEPAPKKKKSGVHRKRIR